MSDGVHVCLAAMFQLSGEGGVCIYVFDNGGQRIQVLVVLTE